MNMASRDLGLVLPEDIDEKFVPRQRAEVTTVEIDGEAVLYDELTHSLHVLNPTAALLWACFDGDVTLDQLATEISGEFGVDAAVVREQVVDTARGLARHGLLSGVASTPVATAVDPDEDGCGDG